MKSFTSYRQGSGERSHHVHGNLESEFETKTKLNVARKRNRNEIERSKRGKPKQSRKDHNPPHGIPAWQTKASLLNMSERTFEAHSWMWLTATTQPMALERSRKLKSMRIVRNLILHDIPPTNTSGENRSRSPHNE
jgi:hypothetical protein